MRPSVPASISTNYNLLYITAVTGYIRGGCTPIGMKKQYKTVYHSTIKDFDKVIVSGGKLGTQIILAPDDLIKVTRADVCDIVKD